MGTLPLVADLLVVSVVREDAIRSSLRVTGELDLATAGQLANALAAQLSTGRRYTRLDLSGVTFCDCTGLGVLVQAHHRFLAARGTLILIDVSPRIARLLTITALDEVVLTTLSDQDGSTAGLDAELVAGVT